MRDHAHSTDDPTKEDFPMRTAAFLRSMIIASVAAAGAALAQSGAAPADGVVAGDDMCILTGAPPDGVKYVKVKDIKLGKGSFGSVKDMLDGFAGQVRQAGGEAVINYNGSQRFGFWPWRFVRPVVRGTAIRWEGPDKPECSAIGGTMLKEIIATNIAPPPPGR
ncbi:MAG: hypothetical protein QM761_08530 [Pseudoxanthomonas sp.]